MLNRTVGPFFIYKNQELEERKNQRSRKDEKLRGKKKRHDLLDRRSEKLSEHSVNETNGPTITETAKGNGFFGPIFSFPKLADRWEIENTITKGNKGVMKRKISGFVVEWTSMN